jgi:hypothetical protein
MLKYFNIHTHIQIGPLCNKPKDNICLHDLATYYIQSGTTLVPIFLFVINLG